MKKHTTGMLTALALAGVLALGGCSQEIARSASSAIPVGESISADHLERIDGVLQDEVDRGVRAGFVAAVMTREGVVYKKAFGEADPFNDVAMTTDARFRIASMTKPIISVAAMQLVDRGVIGLNDPISLFIPAYANPKVATEQNRNGEGEFATRAATREITVHDLLTHMSGIGYVFSAATDLDKAYLEANLLLTEGTLEDRINIIAALPLYNDPGTIWSYSFSTDVLGRVIEAASGMPLEDYLKQNIFDPLGMDHTEFFLDETDFEGLATVVEFNQAGEMVRAEGNALSTSINDEAFGVMSGGAGLVSSVDDYARFMRMMLNGGELDGARILSPATVRLMLQDHLPPSARPVFWQNGAASFGLGGYVSLEPGYSGSYSAKGEWGWAGYWDTHFFVNPTDNIGVILLAQTQPGPTMPPSRAEELTKALAYSAIRD